MSCVINKEYTLEQGKENYYMLTCDFGSLQWPNEANSSRYRY